MDDKRRQELAEVAERIAGLFDDVARCLPRDERERLIVEMKGEMDDRWEAFLQEPVPESVPVLALAPDETKPPIPEYMTCTCVTYEDPGSQFDGCPTGRDEAGKPCPYHKPDGN